MQNLRDKYLVLPNTEEHKSPFFKDKETKDVILVEHFTPDLLIALQKKNTDTGDNSFRLKLENLSEQTQFKIGKRCTDYGLNFKSQNISRGIYSIDCKRNGKEIEIMLSGFESYNDDLTVLEDTQLKSKTKDSTLLAFRLPAQSSPQTKKIGEYRSKNPSTPHHIELFYAQKIKKAEKFESLFIKPASPSVPVASEVAQKTLRDSIWLYAVSLLGSKLGFENNFAIRYKPKSSSGYYVWQLLFPTKILSENKSDSFLESGLIYNYPLRMASDFSISAGAGLKAIKFGESSISHEVLLGPEFKLGFSPLKIFGDSFNLSSSIRYTPVFLNSHFEGWRVLWHMANFHIVEFDFVDLSLTLRYSHIEMHKEGLRFNDSKFLGGILLIW